MLLLNFVEICSFCVILPTNQPTNQHTNGQMVKTKTFMVEMQFKFTRLAVQLCCMNQRIHLWSILV